MRALSIVHQSDAGPGVFADSIRSRGVELETWSPPDQASPPRSPGDYAAVLTFGGAMHVDQDDCHPWLERQRTVLRELLERRTPLLAVCLGAQLLAQAAGGTVRRAGRPEIGWHRVDVLADAAEDPLLGPLAPGFEAFQWHSYECTLPPRAAALARSDVCLQAFRAGDSAWGIQFHAEVSAADARAWLDDYRSDEDAVRIGLDAEALRAELDRSIGAWNRLGRALCDRFLVAAESYSGVR